MSSTAETTFSLGDCRLSTHAEGYILSGSAFQTQQGVKDLVAPEVGTISMEQEAGYFVESMMIYLQQSTIAVYLICGSCARMKKSTITMRVKMPNSSV